MHCWLRCCRWFCVVQSSKRQEVAGIIESLEALNPLQQPTQHLDQLAGKWVLLYTTITITVSRFLIVSCQLLSAIVVLIGTGTSCSCRCMPHYAARTAPGSASWQFGAAVHHYHHHGEQHRVAVFMQSVV
jgi:hypothetical protein